MFFFPIATAATMSASGVGISPDLYPTRTTSSTAGDLRNPFSLKLWWRYLVALATPFKKRSGIYEKACDIFEVDLTTVISVRNFSAIFESYAQFEQSALSAKHETVEDSDEEGDRDEENGEDGIAKLVKKFLHGFCLNDDDDVDLRLARYDHLLERRPDLLNSVILRQNPHNVKEWHN